jgi:hypothetical protein
MPFPLSRVEAKAMKPTWIVETVVAAALAPLGQAGSKLTVWLESPRYLDSTVLAHAEDTATRIFAQIGVDLEWKLGTPPRGAAGETLQLVFDEVAPLQLERTTMGYARLGGSGIAIHILYYRVLAFPEKLAPSLLGHVMAHEMTHVLEGVARHSDEGLMKAVWDSHDNDQMKSGVLPFAPIDARLVTAHFAQRAPVAVAQVAAAAPPDGGGPGNH